MTGPRSAGCLTCRRRKVKCDETKPSCNRCVHAKVKCQGYQKPLTIVDERRKTEQAVAKVRSVPQPQIRTTVEERSNEGSREAGHSRTMGVFTEMPIIAFRRNLFISFLLDKLSNGRQKYQNWWVLSAQDNHTPSLALDALITKFFGLAHVQKGLITEATRCYTQALSSLRQDLSGDEAFSFGTLAATATLSMYELLSFSSHTGWVQHAGGLSRLIQSRGPRRHKTELEKKVLLESRPLLISQALLLRKKTFLGEHNWKNIPWEDDPRSKEAFDYLNDIGCDVAGILEDIDRLSGSRPSSLGLSGQALFVDLERRTSRAFDELDAFWRAWATTHLYSCTERPSDASLGVCFDEQGPLFDTVLYFDTFWSCYITVSHNGLRIILLGVQEQLCRSSYAKVNPVKAPLDESNPLPLLGISTDKRGLALEIFRSLEFCEFESRKFLGTYCVLFQVYYAQECLDPMSRERRWVSSLPIRSLESFRTFKVDAELLGLPSCGTGMFGFKVASNTEMMALGA